MDTGQVIVITALVLLGGAFLWGVFLVRTGRTRRSPEARLGIPQALRPGQPDEVLEGSRLERLLAAGFVASIATAIFIPLYWLPEAQRQADFEERFHEESVERGRLVYQVPPPLDEDADPLEFKEAEHEIALGQGCAGCHGAEGVGGFASVNNQDPVTGELVNWVAPPLNDVFSRWDEEIVRFTIERGRPGTPMPTWGVEYGGPMTVQMVDDVINYLHSIQVDPEPLAEDATGAEIFAARCAVCHGPEGQGREGPPDQVLSTCDEPNREDCPIVPTYYPGMALWKGDVDGLAPSFHLLTIRNGRRFAFMPQWAEAPSQGIPVPPMPLTDAQIEAVMEYERGL